MAEPKPPKCERLERRRLTLYKRLLEILKLGSFANDLEFKIEAYERGLISGDELDEWLFSSDLHETLTDIAKLAIAWFIEGCAEDLAGEDEDESENDKNEEC